MTSGGESLGGILSCLGRGVEVAGGRTGCGGVVVILVLISAGETAVACPEAEISEVVEGELERQREREESPRSKGYRIFQAE